MLGPKVHLPAGDFVLILLQWSFFHVDSFSPRNGKCIGLGEGGKEETFVSCDICLLLSAGQEILPFFGLSVVSLCPVMHNPSQEKERIQALCLPEETSQRHSIIVDASLDLKKNTGQDISV